MAGARYLLAAGVGGLMAAVPIVAEAQNGTVTGRVTDSTSQAALGNVTIRIDGTQRGALTREDGSFVVTGVPAGTYRVIASRIGFAASSREVTVTNGGSASVQFTLRPLAAVLQELVVVGYGTQRREAVTGSVAQIKAEDANVGVVPNANALLTARVAGVNVTQNNGEPGAGAQIRVRGGTSLSASNEPLYVVDGVPLQNDQTVASGIGIGGGAALARSPLNAISPNDIQSITVLKDASATAIYGSRGANGVVLIETKRGSGAGRNQSLEYETYVAAGMASNKLDFLTGSEYRSFINGQVSAGKLTKTVADGLGAADTDWESELTRTSVSQNHNLAFSGGSNQTQYRASLNFFDQQGVVINNGLQRYQGRINAQNQSLGDKLQLGVNLMASRVNNKYLPFENTGGFEGGVFTNMAVFNPTFPVIDPKTATFYEIGAGSQSVRNPVALAQQIDDRAPENRVLGNVTASYPILSSLTARSTLGLDYSSSVRRIYFPRANPVGAQFNGLARQEDRDLSNLNFQGLLTWSPEITANQEFEVVGGYEYTKFDNSGFLAETRGFITDAFKYYNLGAGIKDQSNLPSSYRVQSLLSSFFGRANYSFRNKYFLTGVLRYDGSSRLAEGNQWQLFPAISGSWKISEESFADGLPFFSSLSVRAGYGLQGNQSVDPYQTELLLRADPGLRYPFGSTITTGLSASQVANPNLKWETSVQTNIGIDYGFANDRFTGSVDVYQKDTRDLLLTVSVPQPAVVNSRIENIGSIRNRGIEATLDGEIFSRAAASLSGGLVLSVERNEVKNLGAGRNFIATGGVSGQGQSGQISQRLIPGEPVGTFFGPVFSGYNGQGQQLFNSYTVTRDASGRETGRTLKGTTTDPTEDDKIIIGNANPSFSLGLRNNATMRKFDVSWLWRAEVGRDVFNNTALVYQTKGNAKQSKNFLREALTDQDAIDEPAKFSSRWIENGSFVRLQNITAGYTFNLPGRLGSRATRVYVSGDNLLLFTGYNGYDPEVFVASGLASRGIDYLVYPRARTFTTGARIQF